jgi:hypothetical protein
MLIMPLLTGLLTAIAAAAWGLAESYSIWSVAGLYTLGGSLGIAASAMMIALRH